MIFKKIKQHLFFKNKNALELIPIALVGHEEMENGMVQLLVQRFRFAFLNRMFQRSQYFRIKLDMMGSKVWKLIDGSRNINEIASVLGSDENIPERVVLFITDLYRKELVDFKK